MTADQVAAKMARRQKLAEKAFQQTIRGVATSAVSFTKMKMTEEIYAIPEDLSASGKRRQAKAQAAGKRFTPVGKDKKWRRTGNLRRSEKFLIVNPYEVHIVNTAAYAEPRHEAGKPGRRNINPLRISHWRDDLKGVFHEEFMLDLYRQTVADILNGGGR